MAVDGSVKGDTATTAQLIWMFVTPIIFTFGVVGNIFTIIVLQHRKKKQTSTSLYLTYLAISDICLLFVMLPRWWMIYMFNFDIRHAHDYTCKLQMFMQFTAGTWSSFFLVALTIERMLSTTTPHTVKLICIPRIAKRVALFIFVFIPLLSTHVLYGFNLFHKPLPKHNQVTDANVTDCDAEPGEDCVTFAFDVTPQTSQIPLGIYTTLDTVTESLLEVSSTPETTEINRKGPIACGWASNPSYAKIFKTVLEPAHSTLYELVPEVVFVIAAVVIVRQLSMGSRLRKKMTADGSEGGESRKSNKNKGRVNQVTVTLLMVNVTFVVCTTPIFIFLMGMTTWVDKEKGMTNRQQTIWAIVNQLFFTNHAINFVLYVLIGEKFRRQAKDVLCGWRKPRTSSRYLSNSKTTHTNLSKTESSVSAPSDERF